MYLEIYIDILFLINLVMDFLILTLIRKILKWNTKTLRILCASLIGAIIACGFTLFPTANEIIKFIIVNVITCAVIIKIAFRVKKLQELVKGMMVLHLTTYCVGGIVTSLYYQRETIGYYIDVVNKNIYRNVNVKYIAVTVIVAMICFIFMYEFLQYQKQIQKEIYDLYITFGQACIHTKGLVDTGNCLYDPITGKPVIVIEMGLMKEVLSQTLYEDLKKIAKLEDANYHISNENVTKIRLIPFQSIGKKRGILPAIVLDEVEIDKNSQFLSNRSVIAALYDDVLSQKKEYQVILHKSLL